MPGLPSGLAAGRADDEQHREDGGDRHGQSPEEHGRAPQKPGERTVVPPGILIARADVDAPRPGQQPTAM